MFIFIPPAFDLHLVTYFTAQELTCGSVVFTTIWASTFAKFWIFLGSYSLFTQIGQKAISHKHMSYEGKMLEKWEHPDIAVSQPNIEQ